jgi:hypothetical protein
MFAGDIAAGTATAIELTKATALKIESFMLIEGLVV